mgnify:CR=1 FL=1
MTCQHVNEYEQCQDCPDYPCPLVTPKVAEAILTKARPERPTCDTCPLMRLAADFSRAVAELAAAEEAWASGDVEDWYGLKTKEES